jgi:hypothetical protein
MHVKWLKCRWNVAINIVDLQCDAHKTIMKCMWDVNETQVDVPYRPCQNSFKVCTKCKWTKSGWEKCNINGTKVKSKWECEWNLSGTYVGQI